MKILTPMRNSLCHNFNLVDEVAQVIRTDETWMN
jgi:hypothetical protein